MMGAPPDPFPDSREGLALPIDVAGTQLLNFLVLAERTGGGQYVNSYHIALNSLWPDKSSAYLTRLSEAWAWLVSKALVAPKPGDSGHWCIITRRGYELAKLAEPLQQLRAEERIDVDLHPSIAQKVRAQFLMGEHELAALAAMRQVEIRVRQLAGASDSDLGVKLMQWAFGENGPLRQPVLDDGEQKAMMALFWGAIGMFKNPPSHRQVDYADATMAAEVVLFADLLLRLLDGIKPEPKARPVSTTSASRNVNAGHAPKVKK
jgi:uncharacterized protein (TIGR02391 family)